MRIGITGASGHIGNNLVRRLLQEGHQVRILVRREPDVFKGMSLETVYGDMTNENSVTDFVRGLDVVYHLAAKIFIDGRKRKEYFSQNVEGTRIILEAVRRAGIKRFIYFSSIHAYDPHPIDQPLDENRPLVLQDHYLYNRSKAITQQMVREAFENGLNGVVLNPTAILGPHDHKPSLLGQAVIRMAGGKLPGLIPGGYDWVDVRDVTEAAVKALNPGKTGEAYILSGHWHSLEDLYKAVKKELNLKKRLPVFPTWLARVGAPFLGLWSWFSGQAPLYTQGSITFLKHSNRYISHDKATRELDYHPRPFEVTVKETLAWYKEMKMI
ncbi:MAG: NAD-dependent epimerase/dehydratase family protein [Bacteroidales bacterium]|nr:NAD-dependent epimerase/dehydratase family protein [Bacteroidales bacterium]